MSSRQEDFTFPGQSHSSHHYGGHTHFWERAMLSRRQFMGTAAGVTGIILGSGLWRPDLAFADADDGPRHIPGGIQPFGPGTEVFHLFLPGEGNEPSTIFDFHGFIGLANVDGTGTGIDTATGATTPLVFDVDTRFMRGTFIGLDGEQHRGTFGFI